MGTTSYGNVAKGSHRLSKKGGQLTMWALILMTVNISGSFAQVVNNYINIGYSEAPAFLVAIIIYLIPFTFIIIEFLSLSKTKGDKSGLMGWVKVGAGRKLAFITAFMFWFANLTYFMGALPQDINNMFFAFTGRDVTGESWYQWFLPFGMVAMFAVATFLSCKGTRGISILMTIGGTMFLVIIIIFFIVSSGAWFGMQTGMLEGYGGVSEGGFYITNTGIVYIDTGVWIPTDSVIYFDSQEQMNLWITSANNTIQGTGGSIVGSINELGNSVLTVTNSYGEVTQINITTGPADGAWAVALDHTYATAENPFIINENLLHSEAGEAVIWGAIGGMNWMWFSTFVWVIMACDGMQGYATFADDVKGGRKQFSKGLLIGALIAGTIYTLGMFFVSVFPGDSLANSSQTAIGLMAYFVLGNLGFSKESVFSATFVIVGWAIFISKLASLLVWTAAPVRTLFTDSDNGVFGSWLTKKNDRGVPYRGAWLQFWIMVPLLVVPYVLTAMGTGDSVDAFMSLVKTAGGSLGMIPPMLIFFAYFNLRLKHDKEDRSFRMGSRTFGLIVGGGLLIVYVWIFGMAFVPYDPSNDSWWIGTALNSAALIFVFLPVLFYYLWFEHKQKNVKIAIINGYDADLVVSSYTNNKEHFKKYQRKLIAQQIVAFESMKNRYDEIYGEALNSDWPTEKDLKNKLKEIDNDYKKSEKEIFKKYKTLFKESKIKINLEGKIEVEKISEYIDKYKYGCKKEIHDIKLGYKRKIMSLPKEKIEKNIPLFKKLKIELLSKQRKELITDISIIEHDINNKKLLFKESIKTMNKSDKWDLKAITDDYIASRNMDILNRKYYWKDKHGLEMANLKGEYLGDAVKLKIEMKHSIKWAKDHSYKKEIENKEFKKFTFTIEAEDINMSKNKKEFRGVRSFAKDSNIKNITDKIVIDNDDFYTFTKEFQSHKITIYKMQFIEIYEDVNKESIKVLIEGKEAVLWKIRIVNYDQYLANYEDWFIEDKDSLIKIFKENKKVVKLIKSLSTIEDRII